MQAIKSFFGYTDDTEDQILSLDQILETKVKLGRSQWLSLISLCILWSGEGCEIVIIGLLQQPVKKEFELTDFYLSFLATFIFMGIFLGALIVGKMSDTMGRRKPLVFASIGICISAFCSSYSPTYLYYLLSRGSFGFFTGMTAPSITGYLSEILPQKQRAKIFSLMLLGFFFGEMLGIFICYTILETLQYENWRLIILVAAIPSLFSVPLVYKYIHESPRFCLVITNQKRKAVDILDEMIFKNNTSNDQQITSDLKKELKLSSDEKWKLEKWADKQYKQQKDFKGNYSQLFTPQNKGITTVLSVMWFPVSMIYYGINILLPTIILKYNEQNNNINKEKIETNDNNTIIDDNQHYDYYGLVLTTLSELPSLLIVYLIADRPSFGRKNTLFYCYLITTICLFVVFILQEINITFMISMSIARLLMTSITLLGYSLTSEVYNTSIRITGLSFTSAVNRLGGVLLSWVGYIGFEFLGVFGPVLILAIFCLISTIATYFIPADTTDQPLDIYQELTNFKPVVMNKVNNIQKQINNVTQKNQVQQPLLK